MNNDVIMIMLDREREFRLKHKAMKKLIALTGLSIEEIESHSFTDLEFLEKVLYCGLLHDAERRNEDLKLEQIEDLLDEAESYTYIVEKIREAFAAQYPAPKEADAGNQQPAEKPANESDMTGKKVSA